MSNGKKRQPHAVDVHVGNRMYMRRTELGMSQTELGRHLKVTFQQVQKYERGANRISASTLHKAAQVLRVPVSFFFAGFDSQAPQAPMELSEPAFVMTREVIKLAAAYSRIEDKRKRKAILDLIRAASGEDSDETPETGSGA